MHPAALSYLGLPGRLIFILLLALAAMLFLRRIFHLVALLRTGRPHSALDRIPGRIRAFLVYVLGQRRLFQDLSPGIMHTVIFIGFLVLFLSSIEMLWEGVTGGSRLSLPGADPYLLPLLDLFRILVILAVIFAAYRRLVLRPARLTLAPGGLVILGLISSLMITDLVSEGSHLALVGDNVWWAPAEHSIAAAASWLGDGGQQALYAVSWWMHAALFLGFLVYLPYSKHLHILAAPPNVFLRSLSPIGALEPASLAQKTLGTGSMKDFSWKQLLDLYSCTECGRCQDACPAHLAGKPLSPKDLVVGLRTHLLGSSVNTGHAPAIGGPVSEESIWSCTTCAACQERCPVFVEHVAKIIELRRYLTERGSVASSTARSLEALARAGNPQNLSPAERSDWSKGAGLIERSNGGAVDLLYWVGCTGAYELAGQQISTAVSRILQLAQVSYAILGSTELCCGDPARRLGEEGLFRALASKNIETLQQYHPRRILTHCPHCYNVLKNEYPQFGGRFSVVHHSELIAELIDQGQLKFMEGVARRVTYQDPCYLGRYNGLYDVPRQVLKAIPTLELAEITQIREDSVCCGGGGGQVWLEADQGQRLNYMRFAELKLPQPQLVATACPFCKIMLDDASNCYGNEHRIQVKDIAELVYENCSLR